MKMKGTVKSRDDSEGTVDVDVAGADAGGHRVTSTAKVVLPIGE